MGAAAELTELVPAIVVQVGSTVVALATEHVDKLVLTEPIQRVPLAAASLRGVALVDGEPALVVDMSELPLGSKRVASGGSDGVTAPHAAGILCRARGERAVLVGGQVRHVGRMRLVPEWAPPARSRLRYEGAAEWRGTVVPLLSVPELLDLAATGEAGRFHSEEDKVDER